MDTKITKKDKRSRLDKEIDDMLDIMSCVKKWSPEYSAMSENLERLYTAKGKNQRAVSLDTIAVVAGNLVGILIILNYEKANIYTSKAMNFVLKGRP